MTVPDGRDVARSLREAILSDLPLTRQCAWCWPPGSDGHDPQASHGICQRHADELRAKHGLAPARAVRGTRNG